MTVKELKAILESVPDDMVVVTSGSQHGYHTVRYGAIILAVPPGCRLKRGYPGSNINYEPAGRLLTKDAYPERVDEVLMLGE